MKQATSNSSIIISALYTSKTTFMIFEFYNHERRFTISSAQCFENVSKSTNWPFWLFKKESNKKEFKPYF